MKFKVGSLFAGIGGICLGFKNAKFENSCYELAWANEIDANACKTYRFNFDHSMLEGDINKVLDPEIAGDEKSKFEELQKRILAERIDVLTGGFPCQAFSIAGERKGFEDERGNLFLSIVKLVKMLDKAVGKPRVLFLENVKNLMAHDKGRTYKVIKAEIEKLGYTVFERVLNTMDYTTIPQNRERIYIVCFANSEEAEKFAESMGHLKPKKYSKIEREEQSKKVLDDFAMEKYYYTAKKYPRYFVEEQDFNAESEGKSVRVNLTEQVNERYQFYQVRRGMYVRQNKSNVCPTLTANMGTGGHNVPLIYDGKGVRKLTPSEAFKIQGFPMGNGYLLPKDVSDAHLYKQAGNAVSMPVIELLATEILKILIK